MKRIAYLFLAIASLLAFACSKDEPGTPEKAAAPVLVSTNPEDGVKDLTASSLSIVFTYDQNIKMSVADQSKVTISGGGQIGKVNAYAKDVTVDVTGLEEGKTYTVSIPAGIVTGYKENQEGAAAASVSFSTKIYVSYDMNPQTSLSNGKATARAKALYKFLLDNYGKKTISGTMACKSGWDNIFADYVKTATGTAPAICGYDYLFMEWPPKAWADCPDYGDISAVKAAWDAGSLIQICWHWNVPNSEAAYKAKDPGQYSFYTSTNKVFKPSDALREGTWQNECINGQIEKLAGYMKLLADADIPVLFRPLHEAAGDYTWGHWFWWGADGADACVKLYKYLYDKLTNTYGLNNLIWVWTVQTSDAGKLAAVEKMEEWYPGDDCVDIVGSDLYVEKGTTQSAVFKRVNDSVKGKKMVALCEFGNLLNFEKCFEEGAPWAYFLSWNDFDNNLPVFYSKSKDNPGTYNWNNTVDDWKSALGSAYVLNRGQVTNWK